ncbi:hypothetical protein KBY97_12890 [Synechococcus sp. ATX 2A4]|uniref:hypothetical protein n=1 Tax=Synechococcus sp. ATX 2A4 TaxID=2823727 RepID=UPI0020CFC999|nr:hypothetical protein [Synechococcus sp. ATX 2A4]MCP9886009.1 hypothetical protein [Synechococcus sp. ATX 2A4]
MATVRSLSDASLPTILPAADGSGSGRRWVVRYRGFVLMPQTDLTWLVRPERSPMDVLPFRAPASSLADVKALVDWRLGKAA